MIPAALAILFGVLGASPADPKGNLAKLLDLPLSPGAVALLSADTADPAVVARLAQALRDPRSETRAAAARLAAVRRVRELEHAVADVLAEESDAEAAREEMRALVAIEAAPNDERLYIVSDRFERRLDPDLARILARQRGPRAMAALLSARPWNLTPAEWANAVWLAARGDGPSLVPAMARALGRGDSARWDALLQLFVRKDAVVGINVAAAALSSPVTGVAGRAAWYLAWVRLRGPVQADWQAISEAREPDVADADTAFAFDLLGRSFGRPAGETNRWADATRSAKHSLVDEVPPESPWLAVMTETERKVLQLRRDQRNPQLVSAAKKPGTGSPTNSANLPSRAENAFNLRAMSGLPRGVPDDTLRVARCKLSKGKLLGLVAVQYYPDGLPRAVGPFETDASDACETAALSLAVLTLAPDGAFPISEGPFEAEKDGVKTTVGRERKTDALFVVARPDCITVMEEADVCPSVCPEDRDEVRQVGGRVEAPKLLERTEPAYREWLRRARKQGQVVLEAIISADGCVQDVAVLQSADPALDLEAARAVAQWKYRPAMLDGIPVRVYLTVTVTFRL